MTERNLGFYGSLAHARGLVIPNNATFNTTDAVVAGTAQPQGFDMEKRVNEAENGLNKIISQRMSEGTAQDMVHHIIHHPIMDTIPYIDTLRKIYDVKDYVTDEGPFEYGIGGMAGPRSGNIQLNTRFPGGLSPRVVTHETAHLLSFPWQHGVHSNFYQQPVKGVPQHNWMMAKIHTMAVEAALGTFVANQLKREYRSRGVDFGEGGKEVDPFDHIPKLGE
jgi:hypothetical protein